MTNRVASVSIELKASGDVRIAQHASASVAGDLTDSELSPGSKRITITDARGRMLVGLISSAAADAFSRDPSSLLRLPSACTDGHVTTLQPVATVLEACVSSEDYCDISGLNAFQYLDQSDRSCEVNISGNVLKKVAEPGDDAEASGVLILMNDDIVIYAQVNDDVDLDEEAEAELLCVKLKKTREGRAQPGEVYFSVAPTRLTGVDVCYRRHPVGVSSVVSLPKMRGVSVAEASASVASAVFCESAQSGTIRPVGTEGSIQIFGDETESHIADYIRGKTLADLLKDSKLLTFLRS